MSEAGDDDGEDKKGNNNKSIAVKGVAVVSVTTGIWEVAQIASGKVSMGIAPVSKIASGAHGASIGPVAYVQETKVEQADTFRGALNKIREQHGAMSEQNDILGGNIDYLQGETARMKECANALKEIANQQQADLDRLNELIEENKKIAGEMRKILAQKRLEEIVAIVLECDQDMDFKLDEPDIEIMLMQLDQYDDVDLDKEKITHSILKKKGDMRRALHIIYQHLPPQYKQEDDSDDDDDDDDESDISSVAIQRSSNTVTRTNTKQIGKRDSPELGDLAQSIINAHPVVALLEDQESKKKDTIDFLMDNPSTMTLGRRIALKLMNYRFYYPPGKDKVVEINDGEDQFDDEFDEHLSSRNKTSGSESVKLLGKSSASLEKSWAFFEHNTLPRYIFDPKPDDWKKPFMLTRIKHKYTKAHQKMYRAEPGEAEKETRLYSPIFTPLKQMGDFGIGVGLYFSTLRYLSIITFIAGLINIPVMAYYRSDEYSDGQPGVTNRFLKGTAICTRTKWVICDPCDINGTLVESHRIAQAIGTYGGTGEEFNLNLGLRNDCPAAQTATGIISFATLCFMVLGILIMDVYQYNMEVKFDEDEQTTQDYSIIVTNPPEDAKDPKEWKEFFESHYTGVHVTCCTVGINNRELLEALVERRNLLQRIRFKLPVGSMLDNKSRVNIAHKIENDRKYIHRLKANFFKGIPEWVKRIETLESSIVELSKREYAAKSIFITFETEANQRDVRASMANNEFTFRDDHKIVVEEAAEPSSVRWQYLDVRSRDKNRIMFMTGLATLVGLTLAAFIVAYFKDRHVSTAPFVIAILNQAFPQFALYLTYFEKHASRDALEVSLYIKIVVFRWVNTAIVTTIVSKFTSTIEPNGLVRDVLNIFIAEIITTNLLQLLDLSGNFKRHFSAPRAQTQEQMNNCMMGDEYFIAERYTNVTKILFLALWYSTIYPATFFLCAAALLINYFSDRYSLMRTWRQIGKIGSNISIINRRLFCSLALAGYATHAAYLWASFPYDNLCYNHRPDNSSTVNDTITVSNIITKKSLEKRHFVPNETDFIKDENGQIETLLLNVERDTFRTCDQNMIRYGDAFPALPTRQRHGWMSGDQEIILYFFSITCVVLIGIIFGSYFYYCFKKVTGKQQSYQFIGEDQKRPFSTLETQSGYIPEVRSLEIPYPLVACDLKSFDHDLFEWNNPELPYSYYDVTADVRAILSERNEKVDTSLVFSPIIHTPAR